MSSCCGNGSNTPPGSTPPANSLPAGTQSPYAGIATIAVRKCGPNPCPAPPVSTQVLREPYMPTWLASLTSSWYGKILVAVGNALYTFKSKCTGVLWYDAATESVTVQNPPFASSVPRETQFGLIPLIVPTVTNICSDQDDACQQEVRQELAAQVMGQADCGDLYCVSAPNCGQVNGPAQNFVRFDRLTLTNLDDIDSNCSKGEPLLFAFLPWKKDIGNGQSVDCWRPVKMRRLRFPANQWGTVKGTDAAAATSNLMVAKRVGGDDANPCMELEMSNATLKSLVDLQNTPTFHPLNQMGLLTGSGTSGGATLTGIINSYPTAPVGAVYMDIDVTTVNQPTNSPGFCETDCLTALGERISHVGEVALDITQFRRVKVTSNVFTGTVNAHSGRANWAITVNVLGLWYAGS